jgi:hypothetical protein
MKNMQLPDRRFELFYGSEILALLARVIGFRIPFMSGRNGVHPAELAVEINVGAAL